MAELHQQELGVEGVLLHHRREVVAEEELLVQHDWEAVVVEV